MLFDLYEVLGAVPAVNAFKWSKQVDKLKRVVQTKLKQRQRLMSSSFSVPDMKELKSRLTVEIKNHIKAGGRCTTSACRQWCLRIMQEMELEEPGRVWVAKGRLPFSVSGKWVRHFMRHVLHLKYGKPRNKRRILPAKQMDIMERFLAKLRFRLNETEFDKFTIPAEHTTARWGSFAPSWRHTRDQVPLPFDMSGGCACLRNVNVSVRVSTSYTMYCIHLT